MEQKLFPESHDAFYARRAKERREAMEQAIKEGKIAPPSRLADIYAQKRAEEVKVKQEQRAAANAPEHNTLEAWRSSPIAGGLKLPPTDPKVLEEKRKIIKGE